MRIVYLVSTLRRTGPTSQLLNIVRNLERGCFQPVIVTLSPEPPDSMMQDFAAAHVDVRSLSMPRALAALRRDWSGAIEQALGIPLREVDVVHSQGVRCDVVSSKHLGGMPRVATARNYPYEDYVMMFGPLLGRIMAWKHIRSLRALPVVIACSDSVADRLRGHGVAAEVIQNGVDTSRYCPATAADRARVRRELQLSASNRLAVSVGSLAVRKDTVRVVQAVRRIPDPNLVLMVVGSGSDEAACRREAVGDARIRFAGQAADVAPYLKAADLFVSASRSEGLPNAALEAIACGLPLVLSDIEPHRELFAAADWAGELFATGDTAALAASIARTAAFDADRARRSSQMAARLFGANHMSRRYQDLYRRLAGERSRP
jgi:glycosyltransferase involved in cell wall biosynthesis